MDDNREVKVEMEINVYEMMEAEQRRKLRKALGEITGLSMLECAKAIKTMRLQLSSNDVEVYVRNELRRRVLTPMLV